MRMNDGFNCCGLGEYCHWPEYNIPKAELKEYREAVKSYLGRGAAYSHIIVTLKEIQNKNFGAMLKQLKFKLVGDAVNPNTNNRLYMYVYMRPDKKAAPKRKPKLTFKK